jgi:hypothetical protein
VLGGRGSEGTHRYRLLSANSFLWPGWVGFPAIPYGRSASLNNCLLVGCEISYADVSGCDFSGSDMDGCLIYRSETLGAKFHNVLRSEESDVPKIKVFQTGRVTA